MPEKYMQEALREAKKSFDKNEVPVGCVIVKDNKIIARGHNLKEQKNDITSHAEINAIKKAAHKLKTWRLDECELYVTLEPCLMCYSAIKQSRIKTVYIGLKGNDKKPYSYKNFIEEDFSFKTEVLAKDSYEILRKFFNTKN